MRVRFDPAPLKETRLSGHALRFAMGGAVTVGTGLVAKVWGPKVGGLFLALPAILPTGIALLVRLHNRQAGPRRRGDRARRAAVIEATGASAAAIGLVAFALVAWNRVGRWPTWMTLAVATLAWAAVAAVSWVVRKAQGAPGGRRSAAVHRHGE
ncbi:MAG TPA: DUF3147 family protein [Polyangia bacterium]